MTTYELWGDIPNGVTVYASFHNLLAIKLESATLVAITEHEGKAGWMQTTGRLKGPFEDVYGGLVASKALTVNEVRQMEGRPRQWYSLTDVPDGVKVLDQGRQKWKRKDGLWKFNTGTRWLSTSFPWVYDGWGPFTEIVK